MVGGGTCGGELAMPGEWPGQVCETPPGPHQCTAVVTTPIKADRTGQSGGLELGWKSGARCFIRQSINSEQSLDYSVLPFSTLLHFSSPNFSTFSMAGPNSSHHSFQLSPIRHYSHDSLKRQNSNSSLKRAHR